jgi:hypothetical protein
VSIVWVFTWLCCRFSICNLLYLMESSLLLSSLGSGALFSIYGGNRSQLWMIEEGGDLVLAVSTRWKRLVLAGPGVSSLFSLSFPFLLSCAPRRWSKSLSVGSKSCFWFSFLVGFFVENRKRKGKGEKGKRGGGKACPGARKHVSIYYWLKNLTYDQIQISRLTDRHSLYQLTYC